MSGLCGWVGDADPATLHAMLAAIDYRGDRTDTAHAPGIALGYRWWGGRPGKSPGIHRDGTHLVACAGTLAPPVPSPAAALHAMLERDALHGLDGAFAAAWWDGDRAMLTLLRDPFGVRSLYYTEHRGVFYFASELKQLLAIPDLSVRLDPAAIHKYLTFSFVPGEDVPVQGVRRLLPGRVATWQEGRLAITPYFALKEAIDPALSDRDAAVEAIRERPRGRRGPSVERRAGGRPLPLGQESTPLRWPSGSSRPASACGRSASTSASDSVEKDAGASSRATILVCRSPSCTVGGDDLIPIFTDLVWKLDLPFGDPVTGPQFLLGGRRATPDLRAVFNGEGGDQLFGGWTSKPMVAAEVYAGLYGEDTREETYLQLLPPLLRARGSALHAGVRCAGRRSGPAARAPAARTSTGERGRDVPQSRAARGHRAEGLAEHPAARRAHVERAGASTCGCRCSTARSPRPSFAPAARS